MNDAKRVYLIRHGESLHNKVGNRLSGVSDVPLSAQGIRQCKWLARKVRKLRIHAVFSSPLGRATESARLVFPEHNVRIEPGLIEFNYGEYEGIAAVGLEEDPIIAQWNSTPGSLRFPGGDSVHEYADRLYETITHIIAESDEDAVACVTHRTAIRLMVAKVLGLDLDRFRDVPCSNCSITELRFLPKSAPALRALNVTLAYLGSEGEHEGEH